MSIDDRGVPKVHRGEPVGPPPIEAVTAVDTGGARSIIGAALQDGPNYDSKGNWVNITIKEGGKKSHGWFRVSDWQEFAAKVDALIHDGKVSDYAVDTLSAVFTKEGF